MDAAGHPHGQQAEARRLCHGGQGQRPAQAPQRSDDHPTADTIYTRVRAQDPKVSLGTVYRNLNLLCENGQLLKVPIPGASDRFDHTLGDHAHAYCEMCGSVTDVLPQALPMLQEALKEGCGFQVRQMNLVLEGICPECQKKMQ